MALLATGLPAATASEGTPKQDEPVFTMSALAGDRIKDVTGGSARNAKNTVSATHGFSVAQASSGTAAVVDRSMVQQGITVAYGASFVDLSWKPYATDARYVVVRDGVEVASLEAGVSAFRDTQVKPGTDYDYQVVPVLPEQGHPDARLWGVKASMPASGSLTDLRDEAKARASAAAVASTTTLSWMTFIPQPKVSAPGAGCDYGSAYAFGGDNRTAFDWKSSKYRTAAHATVTWRTKAVTGNVSVRSTTVYNKRTGQKVATKTASDKDMAVKRLGAGSNYVDIRMVTHATNPFCRGLGGVKGAIDGAMTIQLTTSGNYTIRSGKHRLMPNHHIYIYDGGRVTNVYTRSYSNVACLIGSITCPEADLTGHRGSF
ncbi:hypothetical protein [Streptomyces sp. NPDC015131]|uniref:hypothetical protein n=1 Tax=Streptomyces sp. NPDC015131 TaxID=3364941 RepID=UPI0036F91EE1